MVILENKNSDEPVRRRQFSEDGGPTGPLEGTRREVPVPGILSKRHNLQDASRG